MQNMFVKPCGSLSSRRFVARLRPHSWSAACLHLFCCEAITHLQNPPFAQRITLPALLYPSGLSRQRINERVWVLWKWDMEINGSAGEIYGRNRQVMISFAVSQSLLLMLPVIIVRACTRLYASASWRRTLNCKYSWKTMYTTYVLLHR